MAKDNKKHAMTPDNPMYWSWRKKVGRPKLFKDEMQLWKAACDYFKWCDDNPMYKKEAIKSGDMAGTVIDIEVDRPYTWQGLERHLFDAGFTVKLDDYRANKEKIYEQFSDTLTRITKIIQEQKYTGALVGTYNANLIARDLGMTDKTETTIVAEQPLFPSRP